MKVRVTVVDSNEYSPEWSTDSLEVSAREGRPAGTELATVKATDHDGSKDMGDICRYQLQTDNQPFEISDEGEKIEKFANLRRYRFCRTLLSGIEEGNERDTDRERERERKTNQVTGQMQMKKSKTGFFFSK